VKITTLSIGDELISGRIVDTNAGTIAAALLLHGLQVQKHVTVRDSELDIIAALAELERHSDVIIATGGLGPTADDMTTHAVARATGRRMVVNEEARAHVQKMSARLNTMIAAPLQDKQFMLPSKTTLINNPTGTACGFQLMHNSCHMFFLPGVPSEMCHMLHDSVIPFLLDRLPKRRAVIFRHLNVYGPREAEVDELLAGIANPADGLQMGICVSYPAMKITFRAEGDSQSAAEAKLAITIDAVYGKIGRFVYSEGDLTMAEKVAELLSHRGKTVALAESCTGGMIAQLITAVPGSSMFFLEGAVTYSNAAKERRLGVPAEVIATYGAVSSETASAMADGIRLSAGSDIGLAVTGIAGPDGGTVEKPVGTVHIALSSSEGCQSLQFKFGGSRDDVRTAATWMALDMLRRCLLDEKKI
jgi:nicotinamide-nucleotide amidase